MFDAHDDVNDKAANLERLKTEVAFLAQNLEALTYDQDEHLRNSIKRADVSHELLWSFSHEVIEPIELLS